MAVAMLVAGAAFVEAALASPGVRTDYPWVAHVGAAAFLSLALLAGRVPLQRYRIATFVNVGACILLVSAFIAVCDGVSGIEAFYLWPLLGAAYLLRRREVIGFGFLAAAGYLAALAVSPWHDGVPVGQYVLFTSASAVVVATVRALAENLHRLINTLRASSATDPLTGLLNRRSFDRRFANAVAEASRSELPLSVMLLDLDHFKQVNDEFGHAVGDRALVRFGELLLSQSRASDLVARVGGEEFAVVLPGATIEQALRRAEQFAHAWRVDRTVDGLALTVSIGVTDRDVIDTTGTLLMRADAAVYRAKADGRDRVVLAGEDRVLRPAGSA
ncbi:MAG: GGDEF domain-containing protein [Patulibacter minatonensis]